MFIVHWAGDPQVHVIDRATWQRVGEISVGHNPVVVHRRSVQQLLISDLPRGDGVPGTIAPRLLIFDLADGLSLESAFALPERGEYVGYSDAWLALSNDERYLYYARHGAAYSVTVAVLDLENGGSTVTAFGLPERCYPPALHPIRASSVLSTCGDRGLVRVLSPDRSTDDEFVVRGLAGSGEPRHLFNVAASVEAPDGVAFIYYHGAYARTARSGVVLAGRALPPEKHVFPTSGIARLDQTRLLIAYRDEYYDTIASGFAVFNTDTGMIEHDVAIRHHGTHVLNTREIAIVRDGRIDVLDLTTMTFSESFETTHRDPPGSAPVIR